MAKRNPAYFSEIGVKGVSISNGFVQEEYLTKLSGDRGRRAYRQMRDNDSTIGGILFIMEMLFRAATWTVSSDETGPQAEDDIEFLESVLFKDMDHSWGDVVMQAASMLQYGWQLSEVTYKRRMGPHQTNPARRSLYSDGKIGIRRISERAQETLHHWEIDPRSGDVLGMWQQPPYSGNLYYIPMDKALLFRPHLFKGSPEGRSILRNAYRPWYLLNNLQEVEAIACERELTGMPVVKIPGEYLNSSDATVVAKVAEFKKLVRDMKFNHQAGVVLPSDPYYDSEGKPTGVSKVSLELLSTKGSRVIDIDKAIRRYESNIARTMAADFILLGQSDRGSFALSRSKIDLFAWSLEGWLRSIAEVVNRHLVPKLWQANGMDPQKAPYIVPGRVAPEDLTELGNYIESLSRAGIMVHDGQTEDHLRRSGGLPEAPVGEDRPSTMPVEEPPAEETEEDADPNRDS